MARVLAIAHNLQRSYLRGETLECGQLPVADTRFTRTYELSSAANLIERAMNFHDACFIRVGLSTDQTLELEICNLWWVIPGDRSKLDASSRFRLILRDVSDLEAWGTDEEICSSAIYDFWIENGRFKFMTGDGGRAGALDDSISQVEIATTFEAIERFGIPV